MNIANLSVRARLFLTLSLLGAALVIVGSLGLRSLARAEAELASMYTDNLVPTNWINHMAGVLRDNVIALDEALLDGDTAAFIPANLLHNKTNTALTEKYLASQMAPGELELAEAFKVARQRYRDERDRVLAELTAGKIMEARKLRQTTLRPLANAMIDAGQKLLDRKDQAALETRTRAGQVIAQQRMVSWIVMIVGLASGGLFGWLLVNSMLKALEAALQVSSRIAKGELGTRIEADGTDEFGRLLGSLKEMDEKLCEIVGTVRMGAGTVGSAARQISKGNDDLSQRTQEQASALEETASSMEEMTATVKQNADNARQASQLATGARNQADRGGAIVARAVKAMGEINESSRRISDIISVIDEIAFQTNLLALNAAVEAARAGEQGRGFAVVATEVRNLAQRSGSAAKEIKGLIGESVAKVKAGTDLVDASGGALSEIVESVKRVADIVAEISAASDEQATGINQVNTAVTEMDSVTQQNAALVEQAAAASKSMEHQAQALVENVAFFRIDASRMAASAPPARAAAPAAERTANVRPLARRPTGKPKVAAAASASANTAPALRKASGSDASWQEF